jgi:hypothetical protein
MTLLMADSTLARGIGWDRGWCILQRKVANALSCLLNGLVLLVEPFVLTTKKVDLKSHHPPQQLAELILQAVVVASEEPVLDPVLNNTVFNTLKG